MHAIAAAAAPALALAACTSEPHYVPEPIEAPVAEICVTNLTDSHLVVSRIGGRPFGPGGNMNGMGRLVLAQAKQTLCERPFDGVRSDDHITAGNSARNQTRCRFTRADLADGALRLTYSGPGACRPTRSG
jgi:hypothetical protein